MFTDLCSRKSFYYIPLCLIPFIFIATKHLRVLPFLSKTHLNISHPYAFQQQLFHERLSSYNLLYNDLLPVCNKTNSLTDDQKHAFHTMSELLQRFRKQIVPYPNNHFYGRGIVLTAGHMQMHHAKLNLKMIEVTGTKLSVQV
jgi:hypothetical protein